MDFNPEKSSMLKKDETEKFELLYDKPQTQYLISSLARGPINVAQIVKEGDQYFSHHQKLDTLESKENLVLELESDMLVLSLVFYDNDHAHYSRYLNDKEINEHHNLVINKDKDKAYIYDLDDALNTEFRANINTKEGKAKFLAWVETRLKNDTALSDKVLQKTNQFLSTNFKDREFFDAVIAKTGVDLTDDEFKEYFEFMKVKSQDKKVLADVLFNDIVARLKILQEVASRSVT